MERWLQIGVSKGTTVSFCSHVQNTTEAPSWFGAVGQSIIRIGSNTQEPERSSKPVCILFQSGHPQNQPSFPNFTASTSTQNELQTAAAASHAQHSERTTRLLVLQISLQLQSLHSFISFMTHLKQKRGKKGRVCWCH